VISSVVDAENVVRRAELVDGLRRAPTDFVVGSCARANRGKGVDQWLEAVRLIRRNEPDLAARFVWVGAHDSDVAALAHRLGVLDAVEFVGEADNPYPLIASMDVFTLPSRQDAFPLVVLEAMLLRRPVVAFDVGGVREQLGDCGVLVPAGDVDQFANAIVRLAKDRDLRARLGSAAATRARRQFGIDRFRRQVLTVVEQTSIGTTQPDAVLTFEPSSHEPDAPRALLLTSEMDIRAHDATGWVLPHSADSITEAGWELAVSKRHDRKMWTTGPIGWLVAKLENATAPLVQTVLATRELARADVVIAMFESQGNALAFLRALRVRPFTRPRFAVVSCWLARDLSRFGPFRRLLYRFAYRSVDRLICFSPNQAEIFERELGYPPENVVAVDFGIDHEYFTPRPGEERDYVLSVGRDAGRDWATLFDAVAGTEAELRVACRPSALENLDVPRNVEVLGFVDRSRYRDLIAGSKVVVVSTHALPYPSGQTVTLEAMAMGRCCIVTDTPQVRAYLRDGQNSLLVPPGDVGALRAAIERALDDRELRARLGDAARRDVERDLNAPLMWERIAEALR
jgi:glycosyltransferase involved in cell wall biosynthesis